MNRLVNDDRVPRHANLTRALRRVAIAVALVATLFFGPTLITYGQGIGEDADIEPNDTCASAQDLGAINATLAITGALTSTPESPDVDFFRVTAPPLSGLVIDLEGQSTGRGTLGDPYLGWFSSDCQLQAANDDFGGSFNSRLYLTVPADGSVVIGATACCDGGFAGGGVGSYTLTVAPIAYVQSISGRIVDANTGTPLPSNDRLSVSVELRACDGDYCYRSLAYQNTDADGRFRFERDFSGQPLVAGNYRIAVSATNYVTAESETFTAEADQAFDLGDFELAPVPLVGSISGRVVDAVTGAPLRGNTRPFAQVELRPCEEYGCYYGAVASAATDADGRFRFVRDYYGNPLPARRYQVVVTANQYEDLQGEQFDVADGQHLDLGALRLRSHPLRFTEVRPCGNLPLEGGDCAYSVRVTNGLSTTLEGGVWSLVSMLDETTGSTRPLFQAGNPVGVNLAPGSSQVVHFQFNVPESAPDNRPICAEVIGGRAPTPYFNAVGRADLFCITKGTTGFAVLSDAEANAVQRPQAGGLAAPE
jgi:hypothetical protein